MIKGIMRVIEIIITMTKSNTSILFKLIFKIDSKLFNPFFVSIVGIISL